MRIREISIRWGGDFVVDDSLVALPEPEHLIFDDLHVLDEKSQRFNSREEVSNNSIQFSKTDQRLSSSESLSNVVKNSEYQTIMTALKSTRIRDQAAQILGISTRTLRHKLQRLREDGMAVTRAYAR